MLRLTSIFLASILIVPFTVAQNPPNQSGAGKMERQQKMSAMHEQMMKDMQTDLDSMRANLQKMKDQLSKVTDQSTKDELQVNIDMWQSLINNMDKHMSMMKQMMGPGHGMMMHKDHNMSAPKK